MENSPSIPRRVSPTAVPRPSRPPSQDPINYEMWTDHMPIFDAPRPTTAVPAKAGKASTYSFAVEPLASLQYKTFQETALSSKELLRLRQACRAQPHTEFPFEHCKVAAFKGSFGEQTSVWPGVDSWKRRLVRKPPLASKCRMRRKDSVPVFDKLPPTRQLQQQSKSISLLRKVVVRRQPSRRVADKGCVWLYPRSVPCGPCSQPLKGKLVKSSPFCSTMFRPESTNPDVEDRASKKLLSFSALNMTRLGFKLKYRR